ncbi:hypothetical protein N9497_04150 [Akkermansiaceae bacterium]|nr:hypothetical protein [Akkermansiaceae bacterium]
MRFHSLALLGLLTTSFLSLGQTQLQADFHQSKEVDKIVFGSCYNPRDKRDVMFDVVHETGAIPQAADWRAK